MGIIYKKLWKMLIDRDMMKKDLAADAGCPQHRWRSWGKAGT